MVPEAGRTCLGLEYFCFEGDGLWASSDADLQALAARELESLGLAKAGHVVDGISLAPLMKGGGSIRREAIYWHYPHYGNQGGAPGAPSGKAPVKIALLLPLAGMGEQAALAKSMKQAAEMAQMRSEMSHGAP